MVFIMDIFRRILSLIDFRPRPASDENLVDKRLQLSNQAESDPLSIVPDIQTVEPLPSRNGRNFHALLIGIDNYKYSGTKKSFDLSGCVADVDDWEIFLRQNLKVSPDCIVTLRNEAATRDKIKVKLQAFIQDERIQPGDPILIFFAGHGATAPAPDGWHSGGENIQMLVPYDFDPDGKQGQGLYDFKLNVLLRHIADVKGNNITVILDSCHSGSSTRDLPAGTSEDEGRARWLSLPDSYQLSSDEDLLLEGGRMIDDADGYENSGLASHVLLAAASSYEQAREKQGRGVFTQALLALLRSTPLATLTYKDVIQRLADLPHQHPQCEGRNALRILFKNKVPSRERRLYRVELSARGSVILQAGQVHGVSRGARFAIFKTADVDVLPLGELVAERVHAYITILRPDPPQQQVPFALPPCAYALQMSAGNGDPHISILVSSEEKLLCLDVVNQIKKEHADLRIETTDDKTGPHDLVILREGSRHFFDIKEMTCNSNGLRRLPFSFPVDTSGSDLLCVCAGAGHFFRFLQHSNNMASELCSMVSIEAHLLSEELQPWSDYPTLLPVGDNLNKEGQMTVEASIHGEYDYSCRYYGFNIVNHWDKPLYIWIFTFEMNDLSISKLYAPSMAKIGTNTKADPSVPAQGNLTIGYGAGGVPAQAFKLKVDEPVGVTYFKFFFTFQYVDLSWIEQDSPFEGQGRRVEPREEPPPSEWGTQQLVVIQTRPVRGL